MCQAKQTRANQLKALVPVLREMQEILSQKSALHYQFAGLNLPTFTDWAKNFVDKAGIQAGWSTIKAAMNPNRESPVPSFGKSHPSVKTPNTAGGLRRPGWN